MPETSAKVGSDRFEVRVTADSHFAWIRTRLSVERTMMAWLRTATALIGFGFAIVQYLSQLRQASETRATFLPEAPRYLGLSLIGAGVVALFISIWQYRWGLRYLSSEPFSAIAEIKEGGTRTPVMAVAVLLIFIGMFAFSAVLLHLT
jgi:putative membrane protein